MANHVGTNNEILTGNPIFPFAPATDLKVVGRKVQAKDLILVSCFYMICLNSVNVLFL